MSLLANLIFFLAIPAALAAGMAFALANLAPGWGLRLRSVMAALVAGGLPIALPITALVTTSGYNGDLFIPVTALVVAGLFLALVIGFPVALVTGRRLAGGRADSGAFD